MYRPSPSLQKDVPIKRRFFTTSKFKLTEPPPPERVTFVFVAAVFKRNVRYSPAASM